MIKYQLAYTPFDQISDHKYDIHWYGKVFTKLLVQAFNKNNEFMFTQTEQLLFSEALFKKWLSGKTVTPK